MAFFDVLPVTGVEFWLLFAGVSSLAPALLEEELLASEPETVPLALVIMRTMPTPLNTTTMHASIAIAIAVTGCLRDLPGSWAPFVAVAFFVNLPVERLCGGWFGSFPAGFVFGAVAFLLAAFPAAFSAAVVAGIVGIRVVTVLIVGIVCGLVGALAFKLLFEFLQRCRRALLRVSGTAVVSRQPLR